MSPLSLIPILFKLWGWGPHMLPHLFIHILLHPTRFSPETHGTQRQGLGTQQRLTSVTGRRDREGAVCVKSFVGPPPFLPALPSTPFLHWSWGLGSPPRPLPILGIGLRTMQGDRNNSFFEPGQSYSSPNIGTKPMLGKGLEGGSWGWG